MRVLFGEVSEWLKEHAWKVCNGQPFEGSNPSLTAIICPTGPVFWGFVVFRLRYSPICSPTWHCIDTGISGRIRTIYLSLRPELITLQQMRLLGLFEVYRYYVAAGFQFIQVIGPPLRHACSFAQITGMLEKEKAPSDCPRLLI